MGWTHDYSDAARDRRSVSALSSHEGAGPLGSGEPHPSPDGVNIPLILRRRARWVSARLRHTRD
ncbi:hypothetical protein ABZV64_13645 [Streptomyces sp. NPDC004959]|uniref:hypothetical protein n=1 Tax=unclassified Streptomyces TaxID=2593676 RepID=UPI0004C58882|nr:hypothetical protein [Streptomyces sp. NRRL F-5630]